MLPRLLSLSRIGPLRIPNPTTQSIRHFTARRPKTESSKSRETIQRERSMSLGRTSAITQSLLPEIFAIQQQVFGYDRGGEGFVPEGVVVREGKTLVPVRTGRKLMKKSLFPKNSLSWYIPDMMGRERYREMRLMRKSPNYWINERLDGNALQGQVGKEMFGPFPPNTTGAWLSRSRKRISDVMAFKPNETALTSTAQERFQRTRIIGLRKRGKGAPKKGQGKRASGGKAGKK